MSGLHLLRLQPEPKSLSAWAARHRLLSPDGDFGYALHALLAVAFGAHAPKPFRYLDARQGLLGYSAAPHHTLHEHAQLAPPDVSRALGLDALDVRAFPDAWRHGRRIAFEVRIRPIVRTTQGRETDAFLHTLPTKKVATTPENSAERRSHVYGEWLARQLTRDGAATIVDARMDAFRLTRVLRKGARAGSENRCARSVNGPDAVFKGHLQIGDGEAFGGLVARGIGRHRAFGFGMLLLRPPDPC